jgi:hypothetical protein
MLFRPRRLWLAPDFAPEPDLALEPDLAPEPDFAPGEDLALLIRASREAMTASRRFFSV